MPERWNFPLGLALAVEISYFENYTCEKAFYI